MSRRHLGRVKLAIVARIGHDEERRGAVWRMHVAIRLAVAHPQTVAQVVELKRSPYRQVKRQLPGTVAPVFQRMRRRIPAVEVANKADGVGPEAIWQGEGHARDLPLWCPDGCLADHVPPHLSSATCRMLGRRI